MKILLNTSFILLLFSCSFAPRNQSKNTTEADSTELSIENMSGEYYLDNKTQELITTQGLFRLQEHSITLHKDSSYYIKNRLKWSGFHTDSIQLIDDQGKWSIGTVNNRTGNYLFIDRNNAFYDIRIMKRNGKLILIESFGDPDSPFKVIYEKRTTLQLTSSCST